MKTAMRVLSRFIFAAAPLLPGALAAQSSVDPVSESLRAQFDLVRNATVDAANSVPASLYDFRATDEVRTFGQLVGHIANAQYSICSGLLGEDNPATRNYEELESKDELVEAITESWDYCEAAYDHASDSDMGDEVSFFGGTAVRHYPMSFGLIHAYEHYGNMVTYMRLNGLVPPTSQGQ